MWLPADERRLLAGYYRNFGDVDVEEAFEVGELRKLLGWWAGYGWRTIHKYGEATDSATTGSCTKEQLREIKSYIADDKRVRRATRQLALHGLVTEKQHEGVTDVLVVALTVDGYDLGRRYSSCFTRSGLRFEEYRNHWLWLIVACVGGAVICGVIQQVFEALFPKK